MVAPELAAQFVAERNAGIDLAALSAGSPKKVWWVGLCGHEWESSAYNRLLGQGCPFCAGNRLLTGFNDLATLRPDLAAEWHRTLVFTNLANANMRSATLKRANLYAADLRLPSLAEANLGRANLRAARLAGADLPNANLSGADLSGTDLSSSNPISPTGSLRVGTPKLYGLLGCRGRTFPP